MPEAKANTSKQKLTAAQIRRAKALLRQLLLRPRRFILVGEKAVRCAELKRWLNWLSESEDRLSVASTECGKLHVSTVFLTTDHNFFGVGPPLLFETMIFGPRRSIEYQERYSTWAEAKRGHARAVKYAKTLAAPVGADRSKRPTAKARRTRKTI